MRKVNKLLSLIVCVVIAAAAAVLPSGFYASAQPLVGIVTTVSDPLSVRSGPGTGYERIGTVDKGATVTVTDSTSHSGWYTIEFAGGVGYVSSDYIRIVPVYTPDADFEKYLTAQGFPESYKPALRNLHAAHPNWVFNAKTTDMSWNSAVEGESALGLSLIQKLSSYPDSYYSYQQGAYNPQTDKHVVFDGGGWIQASQELIKYSLDPRNYLTEDYIFAFLSLSYSPTETVENINSILKNSFMSGAYPAEFDEFATYADAFLSAAKATGVSSYHLASRCRQEQGTSGTKLSHGTVEGYEGYYNFFHINAYSYGGLTTSQMGASYAKNQGWDTPYKSILGGAQFLAKGYIGVGQDTLYLQKFDLVAKGGYYTHQYMTNVLAAFSESSIFKKALTDSMLDSNLTFMVPVFSGMPSSACARPTGLGDNNYLLKSLKVDGYQLTPGFSAYTYGYELVVDSTVESVDIQAEAAGTGAKVTGTGTRALEYGDNKMDVTVTAQSGTKRTYTVVISRQQPQITPPEPVIPDPSITGADYTVGDYITGISPGTQVADFIAALKVKDGTVTVAGADGAEKSQGPVCSGDKVSIFKNDGSLFLSYETVIFGDINGDDKISTSDLFMGHRHVLQTYTLTGARLKAADINRDGKVSTSDLFMGHRHVLGTYTITQ